MNQDPKELQRELELITAAQLPPDLELDRESAELRETWLAFGKLLDAARAEVAQPAQSWRIPPARGWRRAHLAAMAVLAATVLLSVTGVWYLQRGAGPAASHPSAAVATARPTVFPQAAADRGDSPTDVSLPPALSTTSPKATASPQANLAWDDPLDQEMDRAGRAVAQLRNDTLASAAEPGMIEYQFQNIRKGIDAGLFN